MFVPEGFTESQVLAIMERVIRPLAEVMKFGHYDADDMFQEGCILALSILDKYDTSYKCSLDNFIRVPVRNKFINLRRDKLYRTSSPCDKCDIDNCEYADNKRLCTKYESWLVRNNRKRSLMESSEVEDVHTYCDDDVVHKIFTGELYEYVLENISLANRSLLLRYLDNTNVPKNKLNRLFEELKLLYDEFRKTKT